MKKMLVLLVGICSVFIGGNITFADESIKNLNALNQDLLANVADIIDSKYDVSKLTEDEKNDLASKLINEQISINGNRFNSRSGYNLASALNKKEKELAAKNPFQAATVSKYAKMAMSQTQRSWSDGTRDNGDGNAFQHTYWNLLLTCYLGSYYAEQWTTAHEYGQSGLSTKMDLANNAAGRNTYSEAVRFYKGMLKRNPNDKDLAEWAVRMNFNRRSYKIQNGYLTSTTGATYRGYL